MDSGEKRLVGGKKRYQAELYYNLPNCTLVSLKTHDVDTIKEGKAIGSNWLLTEKDPSNELLVSIWYQWDEIGPTRKWIGSVNDKSEIEWN